MPVCLKDIAQSLNLSVSTVSRVLNNRDRVDPKTRARVLHAVEEMNYRPNEAARALREKSNHTLGIVVPDIGNEFFAQVIKGAEQVAWKAGYSLLVMGSDKNGERERQSLYYLLDKRVAGIVLGSVDPECPPFSQARQYKIPIVFVDNLPSINENYDSVTIDNRLLSFRMTQKLIAMGHRRIALITGNLSETTAMHRREGYLQALKEHGLDPQIRAGSFSREFGFEAMNGFLANGACPTAVFATNNHLAYGAVEALRKAGLCVPRDISLCCFDAFDSSGLMNPQLTSINQSAELFGSVAVNILLRKIAHPETSIYERLILEPEIQQGSTVTEPPATH